ncbi:hypothetical protein [Hyalangium rubrum]|uniref:Lipoprotein n=1 Tax=Hyalangium rubrum TaxID=3103134 RepID=A0ABU5HCJ2_9BACT|nr:hypothetical protein [Hyalangium sp. s54d21]MDY7230872.1 hypothetical protein [Hyalangium sp. s54d21]
MKRIILSLALGVALLGACSDSQTFQTAAGLSGTYDLTIVGSYVFVTSTDRDELRVLDLGADPRDFVRAPNPLEPLAIPVLDRPTYLARDVAYDAEGKEVYGPYIYARSDGAREISIVAAAPEYLREANRVSAQVKAQTGRGFVTAFAARGPQDGRAESILYYATQSATEVTLYRQLVRGPDAITKGSPLPDAAQEVLSLPGETVAALLVLPPSAEFGPEPLVLATRGIQGTAGRTFRMDAANPAQPAVSLAFSAPVRLLATHSQVADTYFGANPDNTVDDATDAREVEAACGVDTTLPVKRTLRAGEYVFGVLDESACGGGTGCTGVLAVESSTGAVAIDSTNNPMLPIRAGGGLPTGMALVAQSQVQIRCKEVRQVQQRPLVAIVPTSSGQITIFDATKLRPFDFNTEGPLRSGSAVVDAAGTAKTLTRSVDAYVEVALANGASRNDTFRIVYQGPLPPPRDRITNRAESCSDTGCAFKVGSETEARFLLIDDLITLEGGTATCELPVVSKTLNAETPPQVVLGTGPVPENCADFQRFSLRAGPTTPTPFAVYSDTTGFETRMALGETVTLAGDYLFHPPDFNPALPPFRAQIKLANVEDTAAAPLLRGDQYSVSTTSSFEPHIFEVEISSLAGGLSDFRLPGPVAHTRVGGTDFAYIAYPSADAILQMNLPSMEDNTPNLQGLIPYR